MCLVVAEHFPSIDACLGFLRRRWPRLPELDGATLASLRKWHATKEWTHPAAPVLQEEMPAVTDARAPASIRELAKLSRRDRAAAAAALTKVSGLGKRNPGPEEDWKAERTSGIEEGHTHVLQHFQRRYQYVTLCN